MVHRGLLCGPLGHCDVSSMTTPRVTISSATAHRLGITAGTAEGTYTFTVYPVDEHGAVGDPCTLTVIAGLTKDGPWSNLVSNPTEGRAVESNLLISATFDRLVV